MKISFTNILWSQKLNLEISEIIRLEYYLESSKRYRDGKEDFAITLISREKTRFQKNEMGDIIFCGLCLRKY